MSVPSFICSDSHLSSDSTPDPSDFPTCALYTFPCGRVKSNHEMEFTCFGELELGGVFGAAFSCVL